MVEKILSFFVAMFFLIVSIVLHECAHGWVACKRGDPTAKLAGRLSLNPIKHIDLVGTIIVPGVLLLLLLGGLHMPLLGWAKPVPVNFSRLRNPKRDMMLVGISGPAINVVLAVLLSRLNYFPLPGWMLSVVEIGVFINLILAVFNMIPIPPLDGSRVVMGLLPISLAKQYVKFEGIGILIVFGLLLLGAFKYVLPVITILGKYLGVNI